jgi:hypothetical protein
VQWVFGALAIAPVVALVVASVRGRAQVRSCCSVAPEQDGRIAAAIRELDAAPPASRGSERRGDDTVAA